MYPAVSEISDSRTCAPHSGTARSRRFDRGATAIEYALIIALVGVIIFAGVTLLGGRISGIFSRTAASLGGVSAGAVTPVVPPAATVPGTVSGVSASSSSVDNGNTVLDWSAPSTGGSPITGYSVYRADEGSVNSGPSSGYSSVASSVTPPFNTGDDHDNCWRVAAVNSVGEGSLSTAVYHNP